MHWKGLECLGWQGSVVKKGSIFRHLGYPLGMNVTNGQLIEWVSSKLRDNFMYWKSQSWSFYVRLKVVQCIMEPMILYYLPLLPWTKKALHSILQPLRYLLWKKRDKLRGIIKQPLSAWWKLVYWTYLSIWWLVDFHYYKTCVQSHNHGYLLLNISLRKSV